MNKSLLRPKIELITEGRKHEYRIDGRKTEWPSVTGVLKAVVDKSGPLIGWAKREALAAAKQALLSLGGRTLDESLIDQVMKMASARPDALKMEAAELGTTFHDLALKIMKGEKIDVPEKLKSAVDGLKSYLTKLRVELISAEIPVASFNHEYVGCFDVLVKTSDGIELWDYKTANRNDRNAMYPNSGVYNEQAFQLGAYALAVKETLGVKVERARILWINKKQIEFADYVVKNLSDATSGFLSCLAWYEKLKIKQMNEYQRFTFDF